MQTHPILNIRYLNSFIASSALLFLFSICFAACVQEVPTSEGAYDPKFADSVHPLMGTYKGAYTVAKEDDEAKTATEKPTEPKSLAITLEEDFDTREIFLTVPAELAGAKCKTVAGKLIAVRAPEGQAPVAGLVFDLDPGIADCHANVDASRIEIVVDKDKPGRLLLAIDHHQKVLSDGSVEKYMLVGDLQKIDNPPTPIPMDEIPLYNGLTAVRLDEENSAVTALLESPILKEENQTPSPEKQKIYTELMQRERKIEIVDPNNPSNLSYRTIFSKLRNEPQMYQWNAAILLNLKPDPQSSAVVKGALDMIATDFPEPSIQAKLDQLTEANRKLLFAYAEVNRLRLRGYGYSFTRDREVWKKFTFSKSRAGTDANGHQVFTASVLYRVSSQLGRDLAFSVVSNRADFDAQSVVGYRGLDIKMEQRGAVDLQIQSAPAAFRNDLAAGSKIKVFHIPAYDLTPGGLIEFSIQVPNPDLPESKGLNFAVGVGSFENPIPGVALANLSDEKDSASRDQIKAAIASALQIGSK